MQEIPDQSMEELTNYNQEELLETDIKEMIADIKIQEENLKNIKPNFTAIKVSYFLCNKIV